MVRLREIVMIRDLKRQGLGISAIAKQTGLDRKTVRKYLEHGMEAARYGPRRPRPRRLDPYADYLRQRVAALPGLSGRRLWREIAELGYAGGYSAVTDFLREVRPPARARFERRFVHTEYTSSNNIFRFSSNRLALPTQLRSGTKSRNNS
ncbi:MAG: helix-turn-helix domain-containing protein [Gammaproteobacteria bacterium]|nr:helix-turn-helix domain-containing protein [Gammaproteobacteria bacterium]